MEIEKLERIKEENVCENETDVEKNVMAFLREEWNWGNYLT